MSKLGKKPAEKLSNGAQVNQKSLKMRIWNNRGFYLMFLPVAIFVLLVYYWPMLGIRYSFFSYKLRDIHFVGMDNFVKLFTESDFWQSFVNTLQLSVVKLLLNTFAAVLISVFLNEMKNMFMKKSVQTIIYLPHFMSYAVVAAIFTLFLSPSSTGFVNETLKDWGVLSSSIDFLHTKSMWRPIFFMINMWKETGWGTVIFLATLSGINPELYEAADIDGATRLQKITNVTLPALSNTIIVVLILNMAKVLNMFEPVFVLYNSRVYDVSDVISTYVYRKTFLTAIPDYGYSTAVGLFKSVVGCILMLICNQASKKVRGRGIM
ncbi:MAG: ABC transporter permease subunit [Lachnospiraceae bacterium]|nr:ABC transporter permease subunit [Lachnospiraceae bacterium]MDN4745155.1 ABC transporter permease subunit [Lachnospiraceae bacterium C1.1]